MAGVLLEEKPETSPGRQRGGASCSACGRLARWTLALLIAGLILGVPVIYHRYSYTHSKRLREVSAGKLYRSGAMTAVGFREAIQRYGIRTVINLQDEAPDPDLPQSYFDSRTERESELCRELGVRFRYFQADLVHSSHFPAERPAAIDELLRIMDDPANYPVLIHCRAGLHRTGCLVAVYRMEYDGWTAAEAIREMKDLGFGEFACSTANHYIVQYITGYQPGVRTQESASRAP